MIDDLIDRYIKLRDKKKQLKDEYEAKVAPYDAAMDKIENLMLTKMQEQGLKSMPTSAGTAYIQTRTSATVADRELFKDWCENTDNWHLIDLRAQKTAIDAYKEEHDDLPPGINYNQQVVVNIRRS